MDKFKTIANRTSWALTALTFLGILAVFLTGSPKIEYRVTFGNAVAAETIQLAPTQAQLDTLENSIKPARKPKP